MPSYEIHFKDNDGQIFETEKFDSSNDAEAVTQAHVLYENSIRHGFVLMRDTRVVLSSPEEKQK